MKKNVYYLLFLSITLVFSACRKDIAKEQITQKPVQNNNLTISEAKNWYESQLYQSKPTKVPTSRNVIPVWTKAIETKYMNSTPVIIAPILDFEGFRFSENRTAKLLFFKNKKGEFDTRILVFERENSVKNAQEMDVNNYTGFVYQVNDEGKVGFIHKYTDGKFDGFVTLKGNGDLKDGKISSRDGGGGGCYSFTNSFWATLWNGIKELVQVIAEKLCGDDTPSSDTPSSPSSPTTADPLDTFLINKFAEETSDVTPSGGGGGYLAYYFDNSVFTSFPLKIGECASPDVEDAYLLGRGLTALDNYGIGQLPAVVLMKKYGYNWANAFAYAYFNSKDNESFKTALQKGENSGAIFGNQYLSGFAPNNLRAREILNGLYGVYATALDDVNRSGGSCGGLTYLMDDVYKSLDYVFRVSSFGGVGLLLNLSPTEVFYLLDNPSVAQQLSDFLSGNNGLSQTDKKNMLITLLDEKVSLDYIAQLLSKGSPASLKEFTDSLRANESKIPAPAIAWLVAKAVGETLIDYGIDLAFSYLTGTPPNVLDQVFNFGANLVGTNAVGRIAKTAKYTAKIKEIADKVKLIRGGAKLAENISNAGNKLKTVLEDVSKLSDPVNYSNRVKGAFDDLMGSAYQARVAIDKGSYVLGIDLRNQNLASALTIPLSSMENLAARFGKTANDAFEVDILENLGGGVLNLIEAKSGEFIARDISNKRDQFERICALAQLRGTSKTKVTFYFRNIDWDGILRLNQICSPYGIIPNIKVKN